MAVSPHAPTFVLLLFYPSMGLGRRKNRLDRIISGAEQALKVIVGRLLAFPLYQWQHDFFSFTSQKKIKIGSRTTWGCLGFLNDWACVLSLLPGGVKHNHCLLLMVFCFLKDWILYPGFQNPSSQCSAFACSSEYRGGSKTPVWESAQGDCYSFYTQSCRRLWSIVF